MTVPPTSDNGSACGGARIRFQDGRAFLNAAGRVPVGALAPLASVVSPGSELRRLRATVDGPSRDGGYITLVRHPLSGGLIIAPAPHGSWVDPAHPRALTADAEVTIEAAAVARFQLIAALGLRHQAIPASLDDATVVGSGPVALGCCLELSRLGARQIALWTRRAVHPFPGLDTVRVLGEAPPNSAGLVLDTTGDPARALRVAAPGATVGLVGTPSDREPFPALGVHRDAITVIGMHELAHDDHPTYQAVYTSALAWLITRVQPAVIESWCLRVAGTEALTLYRRLDSRDERPRQPVMLLDWS